MSPELINTTATLSTVVIVAATAIAALIQLRHLRAGNQINAMLSISNQFDAKEFRDAISTVQHKMDVAMDDPLYRDYVLAYYRQTPIPVVPEEYHEIFTAGRLIGNTYEELGILIKNGIIDQEIFLDRYAWVIVRAWNSLQRALAWVRGVTANDAIWENFEYLTVLSEDFRRPGGRYPKGVRRLDTACPWPVPAA